MTDPIIMNQPNPNAAWTTTTPPTIGSLSLLSEAITKMGAACGVKHVRYDIAMNRVTLDRLKAHSVPPETLYPISLTGVEIILDEDVGDGIIEQRTRVPDVAEDDAS